jgi:putative transposase
MVTAADVQDRRGGPRLVEKLHGSVKFIKMLWGDSHFDTAIRHAWIRWGWAGEVVRHLRRRLGFVVLPKRWVVERTFGWLNRYRRRSKDYERTESSSEAFVHIAMIRLMVRRIS